jgi:hypothetical protein
MIPATRVMLSPTVGSTAVMGCCTTSVAGPIPTKPTSCVCELPSAFLTTSPVFESTTYRSVSSGVMVSVLSLPSRTTTRSSAFPGFSRIIAVAWSQLVIAVPSSDLSLSPGRTPAAAAGATGSLAEQVVRVSVAEITHCETLPTVVLDCEIPNPQSRTA